MYYTLYQKRVYRVYQGGVYPDTADDPCPAALVAGYSDTPRYTGMYRYSYTADTRYIPIQHPSDRKHLVCLYHLSCLSVPPYHTVSCIYHTT